MNDRQSPASPKLWLSTPFILLMLLTACGGVDNALPERDVSRQALRAGTAPALTMLGDEDDEAEDETEDEDEVEVVVDGSFEAGTDNPYWSATPGTLCTTQTCGDGAGTAGPEDGVVWAWFGGSEEATTQTLEQTVALPRGDAELEFKLWAGALGASFTFTVSLDDRVVYTLTPDDADDFDKGYEDVEIDVSSYTDDKTHALRFTFVKDGLGDANLSLDEVSLEVEDLENAVQDIVVMVRALSLKKGLEGALVTKLNGATRAFGRSRDRAGANTLKAFTNQVKAKSRSRGKKQNAITPEDAGKLIASAEKLIAAAR